MQEMCEEPSKETILDKGLDKQANRARPSFRLKTGNK